MERTLSDADIQAIAEAVRSQCTCNLSPEAQREMSHHMGMLKDVGGGDYANGIEVFRDLAKRYLRANRLSEYISRALVGFFLVSMLGGFFYVIKEGAQQILKAIR